MANIKDIVNKNNLDEYKFRDWVRNSQYAKVMKQTCGTFVIEDKLVDEIVKAYNKNAEEIKIAYEKEHEEEIRAKDEMEAKKRQMLITSGFNFEGYKIVKYSGYISGDDAINVDRGLTVFGFGGNNTADDLMGSLVKIRRNALDELKEAAVNLGCNAVIGVDFDYLTLDPQTHDLIGTGTVLKPYVFGVTANGNAVVIEKIDD